MRKLVDLYVQYEVLSSEEAFFTDEGAMHLACSVDTAGQLHRSFGLQRRRFQDDNSKWNGSASPCYTHPFAVEVPICAVVFFSFLYSSLSPCLL